MRRLELIDTRLDNVKSAHHSSLFLPMLVSSGYFSHVILRPSSLALSSSTYIFVPSFLPRRVFTIIKQESTFFLDQPSEADCSRLNLVSLFVSATFVDQVAINQSV